MSSSELSDIDTPAVIAKKTTVRKTTVRKTSAKNEKAATKVVEKVPIKFDDEKATTKRVRQEVAYEETEEEEEEEEEEEMLEKPKKGKTAKSKATKEDVQEPVKKKPRTSISKPSKDDGDAETKPKKSRKTPIDVFSPETLSTHPPRLAPTSSTFLTPSGRPTHLIGAHTSTSGGPEYALTKASELGANALAMFLKNQRRWESKDIEEGSVEMFKRLMVEKDLGGLSYGSDCILPHGSYLINLANPDATKRETSYKCFLDDLKRCEQLGIKLYNWHPGSTVGACTIEEGCKNVAESINRAHKETKDVICVIENMAGAGNILGSTWEQLRDIIKDVEDKDRVGVCIDTCHAFAAGYDIRTSSTYSATIDSFDKIVGLKFLKGMHLNDSQGGGLGCRKDRHENIGLGEIGLQAFRLLLRDTRLSSIPLILETPTFEETSVWRREIELLYEIQCMEGSDEEVEVKLGEVKRAWMKERDEIRKSSKKGEKGPKPPKKGGKKGKKDENEDEEDEE